MISLGMQMDFDQKNSGFREPFAKNWKNAYDASDNSYYIDMLPPPPLFFCKATITVRKGVVRYVLHSQTSIDEQYVVFLV